MTRVQACRRCVPWPGERYRPAAQCGACIHSGTRRGGAWDGMRIIIAWCAPHSMEVRAASPRVAGSDVLVPYAVYTSPYPRSLPGVVAFDGTRCGPWTTRTTRALVTSVLAQLDPPGWDTVQRPGLPVPLQHHARTLGHHDHHALRKERPRSCHDDAPPTSPRAPRCFTGGGWCGWAACSAP
jgi:hypothetical protein